MSTDSKLGTTLLRALCYPFLFLSALATVWATFHWQLNFGTCNILFLVWTIAYLALMEILIPYERAWQPTLKEWLRDGIYLIITMFGGGMAVAAVHGIAAVLSPLKSSFSLWFEIPLALGLSSLGSYIFHRITHVHPWLWLVHGIHHVEPKVNVGNNGVNHVLDVFGRRVLAQLPLIILGLSQPAIFVVAMFNTMQGYFVHANIDVRLGWLNYLLVSPEQHRLHHSENLEEAGHYSVDIPFWDLLLGTFTWRFGRKPKSIGVVNPEKFPLPDEIVAGFLNPWRKRGAKTTSLSMR